MADWQDPKTMSTWIWGVSLIVLFLIIYFLLFIKNYVKRLIKENQIIADLKLKTQQDLLKNALHVQEEERSRIALDIHDNLISQLNIIRMLNQNNENRESINEKLKESMKTARDISHDLTPPLFEELSLNELISDYIFSIRSGINIQCYSTPSDGKAYLTQGKIHLFRIFQELITNCLKHAKATKIDVYFRRTDSFISLMIRDNGIGLHEDKDQGIGLQNIESRAQFLNAKYKFKSKQNVGTNFILCINTNKL